MKTKRTYFSIFAEVNKRLHYIYNTVEEGILHPNYNNPFEGDEWDSKLKKELLHKYVPDSLFEQAKLDNKFAEDAMQTWVATMKGYTRPRCFVDKHGVASHVQLMISNKTILELITCQRQVAKDGLLFKTIYNKDNNDKRMILSCNWRLQKLFPNDKIYKKAANNELNKEYILDDEQINFFAQNYMDLVRCGWRPPG